MRGTVISDEERKPWSDQMKTYWGQKLTWEKKTEEPFPLNQISLFVKLIYLQSLWKSFHGKITNAKYIHN